MINPTYASGVAACESCARMCQDCISRLSGAALSGPLEHAAELCESARRICAIAAEEMRLNSGFLTQVCALSAVICRACADECRQQEGEGWQACADACWRAAQECHSVARAMRPQLNLVS